MNRIIHRGFVADGENRITVYITDDKDSLPADIRGYETYEINLPWVDFLKQCFVGEDKGFIYHIEIGELFYETPLS